MKPEEAIKTYLYTNRAKVEHSTLDLVVQDVKFAVFYGMSPLSDDEIRKVVAQWAAINAIGLVLGPPGGSSPTTNIPGTITLPSDSDLIDAVKKAISTINNGVTLGKKGANFNLGVKGLTANLKQGDSSASLGISWTGKLKLDGGSGPFFFSGVVAPDEWSITLSFPQDTYIPDMASLGQVFTEGEKAVGKMADATRSFNNLNDASKVAALIKPHATKVFNAIDAAKGIAKATSGMSFGFKIGSPDPMPGQQGMPGGVQGSVVFTYVFGK